MDTESAPRVTEAPAKKTKQARAKSSKRLKANDSKREKAAALNAKLEKKRAKSEQKQTGRKKAKELWE